MLLSIWQNSAVETTARHRAGSRRFRYLYNHGDVQGRAASRTPLSRRHTRESSSQVKIRRHRPGADWAVSQPLGVILHKSFHDACLTPSQMGSRRGFCRVRTRASGPFPGGALSNLGGGEIAPGRECYSVEYDSAGSSQDSAN